MATKVLRRASERSNREMMELGHFSSDEDNDNKLNAQIEEEKD